MLFKAAILARIQEGDVTLAFRRWIRPTIRTGGTLRTTAGVLSIDEIVKVDVEDITDQDARRAGFHSRNDLLRELDRRSDGSIFRIAFHLSDPDPRDALRRQDEVDEHDIHELQEQLAALDRSSRAGPWTQKILSLIAQKDGRSAGEIAYILIMPKETLKRKIRLLKKSGLTESLPIGYRLSKRGRMVVQLLQSSHVLQSAANTEGD